MRMKNFAILLAVTFATISSTAQTVSFLTDYAHTEKYDSIEYQYLPLTNRPWVGKHFWANRLQDWQINIGRLECLQNDPEMPMRTVHLLSHQLNAKEEGFTLKVRSGIIGFLPSRDSTTWNGFLIGAGNTGLSYKAAALVHHYSGKGGGIIAGIDGSGNLVFRSNESDATRDVYEPLPNVKFTGRRLFRNNWEDIDLVLKAIPTGNNRFTLVLEAYDVFSNSQLASATVTDVSGDLLKGNIALVSHPGKSGSRYWFRDFIVSGKKLDADFEHHFGPILNTFYSVKGNALKMNVQFPPLGYGDTETFGFFIRKEGTKNWIKKTDGHIGIGHYSGLVRIKDWDNSAAWDFKIEYANGGAIDSLIGRVPKEPVDKNEIKIGGISCYQVTALPADDSWGYGFAGLPNGRWTPHNIWFPHTQLIDHILHKDMDMISFLGDQYYESGNPTTTDVAGKNPTLDYFYKWYLFLWDFQEVTRQMPSVVLVDDHDVYQGDIWGEGGLPLRNPGIKGGGYGYDAAFVKIVEQTQTAHNPDPYDTMKVAQNITTYYSGYEYGGLSLAILEDRKFKTSPDSIKNVEKYGSKIITQNYNPADADLAGGNILGKQQHAFIKEWITSSPDKIKIAFTQTVFASVHTTPDGGLWRDFDLNGWPQSARNEALEILKQGQAFLLGGDIHIAILLQHGIKDWEEGVYQFLVPAVSNKYRRWWTPAQPGKNRKKGSPTYTGRYLDGFNNKVTIYAAANPYISNKEVFEKNTALDAKYAKEHIYLDSDAMKDGFGMLTVNKSKRTIEVGCFPADPGKPQFEGWPYTIKLGRR